LNNRKREKIMNAAENRHLIWYLLIMLLCFSYLFILHWFTKISERYPFLQRHRFPPYIRFILWLAEGFFSAALISFIAPGPLWSDSPYILLVLSLLALGQTSEYISLWNKTIAPKENQTEFGRSSRKRKGLGVILHAVSFPILLYFLTMALLFFRRGSDFWLRKYPVFSLLTVLLIVFFGLLGGYIFLSLLLAGKADYADRVSKYIWYVWALSLVFPCFLQDSQLSCLLLVFSNNVLLGFLSLVSFGSVLFFAFLSRRELKKSEIILIFEKLNKRAYSCR